MDEMAQRLDAVDLILAISIQLSMIVCIGKDEMLFKLSPGVMEGHFKEGAAHFLLVQMLYTQSLFPAHCAPTLASFIWDWWHAMFVSPATPSTKIMETDKKVTYISK